MSLKYGLNLKKAGPPPARKTLLDDDDDFDDDGAEQSRGQDGARVQAVSSIRSSSPHIPKPHAGSKAPPQPRRRGEQEERQDLSSTRASHAQVKAAEEVDASIFDYDSFHDAKTTVSEARKAAARQDAVDRKPKYIDSLVDAAARRKQDQLVAREKLLQREREAEGDEFADKEKFVTGAYKQQQEEARRLEEEEEERAQEEERKRQAAGGGMQQFYRGMIAQREAQHQEAVDAASKLAREDVTAAAASESKEKTDVEIAAELKAKGVNVHINDEGQITDKRELLTAGLNVASTGKSNGSGRGSDHLRTSARSTQSAFSLGNGQGKQAQRERQTRMMEEQLAAQSKRAREEENEERTRLESAAKTTKTEKDVSDAKARYLARKAAREKGEG